jgi:selenocysteine lyase/cysteine desulfurase
MDIAGENLDAAYFSPHKYVGGPQTPGLLLARRTLFQNAVPTVPGGGTVDYVQPHSHSYLQDIEHREEGGTPAIVESIRAGLVFQLHNKVGTGLIEKTETRYLSNALKSWSRNSNIALLGGAEPDNRISIVSFLIRSPSRPGLFLHHNFVVTLLNDVFGIQSRGGCSCAGPYGHALLDIDQERSDAFIAEMKEHGDAIKPGWARVAFGYYFSPATVDYMIDAVHWVGGTTRRKNAALVQDGSSDDHVDPRVRSTNNGSTSLEVRGYGSTSPENTGISQGEAVPTAFERCRSLGCQLA